MESYRDLVNEVARNTGAADRIDAMIPQILIGIHWAETELHRISEAVNFVQRISLTTANELYNLPHDFNTHREILITNSSLERYEVKEVEFDELLRYEPASTVGSVDSEDLSVNPQLIKTTFTQTKDEARFGGKVLYAIFRSGDGYQIAVKPRINGILWLYYSVLADVPQDIEQQFTALPYGYWSGIVTGATYYILRRDFTLNVKTLDPNVSAIYGRSIAEYKREFDEKKAELAAEVMKRNEPAVMVPFEFYDHPEAYKQG